MRLAGVKELKQQTMKLLNETAKGNIITAHGKPKAVLHHLTEENLGDYLIEHDPAFRTKIEAAYADSLTQGGVSGATMLARLKRKRAAKKV